jgi:hypothetical protein
VRWDVGIDLEDVLGGVGIVRGWLGWAFWV